MIEAGTDMKETIVLMVKAPLRGKVKTRLARDIGDGPALKLYKAFTEDILDNLEKGGFSPVIGYCEAEGLEHIKDWLGNERDYLVQKGSDIGERQGSLLEQAFLGGAEKAVVMSSDCPGIDTGHIRSAFKGLDVHDCVICPAEDGGYCLIGFKKSGYKGWPYGGISWSTPHVTEQIRSVAEATGIGFLEVGYCFDIDDGEGLFSFLKRPDSEKSASRTWRVAVSLDLIDDNGFIRPAP